MAYMYNSKLTLTPANQHQPDCCLSLVTEWLVKMREGEAQAIGWCTTAHAKERESDFYALHIATTRRLNRQDEIDVATADQQSLAQESLTMSAQSQQLLAQVRQAQIDPTVDLVALSAQMQTLRAHALSRMQAVRQHQARIAALLTESRPYADHLMRNQMQEEWSCKAPDDCAARLQDVATQLSPEKRYFILHVQAHGRGHVIGLVSTKSSGCFSPNGDLYYYDPNMKEMVKFRSRRDFLHFWGVAVGEYDSFVGITKLQSTL